MVLLGSRWILNLAASVALLNCSCSTKVEVTATNPLSIPQGWSLVEQTSAGAQQGETKFPAVPANSQETGVATVKNGANVTVVGNAGYRDSFTVSGNPDPLRVKETLTPSARVLTDAQSLNTVVDAFRDLGPSYGFPAVDPSVAVNTLIGGFYCLKPANGEIVQRANIIYSLQPGRLSPRMTLADIDWTGPSDHQTMEVTSAASITANLSVPAYGAVKAQTGSTDLAKYDFQLIGFGPARKNDPPSFILESALNSSLSDDEKTDLLAKTTTDEYCIYLNSFWKVEAIAGTVSYANQVTSSADVSAASVLTTTGTYNYSSSNSRTFTVPQAIVNFYGDGPFKIQRVTADGVKPVRIRLVPTGAPDKTVAVAPSSGA